MDHLRNSYAIDRRAEWSIWMVYSKVEMPQQPTRNETKDSSYHGLRGKVPVLRKITEDVSLLPLFNFVQCLITQIFNCTLVLGSS